MTNQPPGVKPIKAAFAGMLLLLCQPAIASSRWGIDAVSGVDCFLVEKATLIDDDRNEGSFGRANVGHQIGPGNNIVLAIRAYENGGRGPDDQTFKKASLEFTALPDVRAIGQAQDVPVLRSYYTDGASGFVTRGRYAQATKVFTTVRIVRSKRGIEASVNALVKAKDAAKGQATQANVAWTCPVIRRTVEQLDVWEGKAGTTWGSFYPRKPPPSQTMQRADR